MVDNTHSLRSISNNSAEVFSYRKHLQVPFGASIFIAGKSWCGQDKVFSNDLDYSFLYSKSKNDVYERYKRLDYTELNNDTTCDIRVTKNYINQVITARVNIIGELRKLTPTLNERLEYSTGGLFCRIEVGSEVASLRQEALCNNIYLPDLWANIPSLSSGLKKELETHLILPLDPFTSPKGLDNLFTFAKNHL